MNLIAILRALAGLPMSILFNVMLTLAQNKVVVSDADDVALRTALIHSILAAGKYPEPVEAWLRKESEAGEILETLQVTTLYWN